MFKEIVSERRCLCVGIISADCMQHADLVFKELSRRDFQRSAALLDVAFFDAVCNVRELDKNGRCIEI
jgi:hypothetical protein